MNVKEFNETVNVCNKSLQDVLLNIGHEAPALQSAATIEYAEAIAKESVRNNMGLVRVLFLGASNSGKSALINNLARKIIVPGGNSYLDAHAYLDRTHGGLRERGGYGELF